MNMTTFVTGITIVLGLCGCSVGSKVWNDHVDVPRHLYSYSGTTATKSIKRVNSAAPTSGFVVSRDANGNTVRFRAERSNPTYVFQAESSLPTVVTPPSGCSDYWLDNSCRIVAWSDSGRVMRFLDNRQFELDKSSGTFFGLDDSGSYLWVFDSNTVRTTVYRMSELTGPAVVIETAGPPERVLLHGRELVLCCPAQLPGSYGDGAQQLHILKLGDNDVVETTRVTIPKGAFLVDLDPWSETALIREYKDLPMTDVYYLFDIRTQNVQKIGAISPGIWLFLDKDILSADRLAAYKVNE